MTAHPHAHLLKMNGEELYKWRDSLPTTNLHDTIVALRDAVVAAARHGYISVIDARELEREAYIFGQTAMNQTTPHVDKAYPSLIPKKQYKINLSTGSTVEWDKSQERCPWVHIQKDGWRTHWLTFLQLSHNHGLSPADSILVATLAQEVINDQRK